MKYSFNIFIRLLLAYLENEKLNTDIFIDWNDIILLSRIHNVEGMIYVVLKNSQIGVPENVMTYLSKMFIATVRQSINQENELSRVIRKFQQEDIDIVLMKGIVTKRYFPNPELRTMGDIDLLIKESDREKSDYLLKEIGFAFDKRESGASVWNYTRGSVLFEVHTSIIYQQLFLGVNYTEYFKNVLDNVDKIEENVYEMKKEYHFIYVLVHLAKHLYRTGSGIRMVMDIVVLINEFYDKYDWDYIRNELEKIKLLEFSHNLIYICYKYFNCKVPDEYKKANDKNCKMLLDYIIKAGVFGQYNRDQYSIKYNLNSNGENYDSLSYKVKNLFKIIFPSYETMSSWFGWFRGKPKWYLPIGWVRRWIINVYYKKYNILKKIKGATKVNNDAKEHNEIMERIGLL